MIILTLILLMLFGLSLTLGIHYINKVEYYAWNMPEAYIPAKFGSILMFLSGVTLGLLTK